MCDSVPSLTDFLTSDFDERVEKVKAIHRWITTNIRSESPQTSGQNHHKRQVRITTNTTNIRSESPQTSGQNHLKRQVRITTNVRSESPQTSGQNHHKHQVRITTNIRSESPQTSGQNHLKHQVRIEILGLQSVVILNRGLYFPLVLEDMMSEAFRHGNLENPRRKTF